MTKAELEAKYKVLEQENLYLKLELANIKKMLFGAKRERFVAEHDPAQGALFDLADEQKSPPSEEGSSSKDNSKKQTVSRKGIKRNEFPAKLQREEQILEAQGIDPAIHPQIGEDVTEVLAYRAGSLYVKRTIRPIRVLENQEDQPIRQAAIPCRLIPKGMVDESLLAYLVVEKILFHTPIHRFRKKLKQAGVDSISANNLYNWFHKAGESLLPLYHLLKKDLLAQAYLQADETPIPVLTKDKPGATHRGYLWGLYQPELKAVYFQYDAKRSGQAAKDLLEDYEGILQTDGYEVYESLASRQFIRLIHCMAHARRKFVDAQNTDPPRARYFLEKVQQLYLLERKARQERLSPDQRLKLRKQQAVPILEEIGRWLELQFKEAGLLPKSPMGKAVSYTLKRWKGLSAYAQDGQLEIDNNLIENTIRPIALGRKNYLFAGSHDAAQQLACLYSIIGTSQQYNLNATQYLEWLLTKVATTKVTDQAIQWLPHRMKKEELAKFRT